MGKFKTLSTCLLAIGGHVNALSISGIGGTGQIQPNASLATKVANSKLALSHLNDTKVFANDKVEVPHPGNGFDSRTHLAYTSMCLANANDPTAVVYSDPQGIINFTSSLSGEELASKLNANISGKADFGLFSASISANYIRANSNTSNRLSYNYMQAMTLDAAYKIPGFGTAKALTQDAQDALTYGKDVFTNYCGDSFITSAKVGAMLIISASIEFASKGQKEAFEGSASGSIAGLGSISGAFKQASGSSTKNAKLNINIIQQGGDVFKLANALGTESGEYGYYAISCSAGHLDDCNRAISKAIHYAQTDFQTSIDLTDLSKRQNYYTWDTNQKTYKSIGVGVTFPILTPEGLAAKQHLVKQVQADREMLAYLQRYQQQHFYESVINFIVKDNIKKITKDYNFIVNQYTQMGIIYSCYGAGTDVSQKCIQAAQDVENTRNKFQDSINRAKNLSTAYVVAAPMDSGGFGAVSISDTNSIIDNTYSFGSFIPYNPKSNEFYNGVCKFDSTPNNQWAYETDLKGKFIQCYDSIYGKNRVYMRRAGTSQGAPNGGVIGYEVDGLPQDIPELNVYGQNAWLILSTDDFKYNPI